MLHNSIGVGVYESWQITVTKVYNLTLLAFRSGEEVKFPETNQLCNTLITPYDMLYFSLKHEP